MQPPPHIALAALAAVLLVGCGSGAGDLPGASTPLLRGADGAPALVEVMPAAALARRFAAAYARNAYRRHPPRLPGATPGLTWRLAGAAMRVPPSRRRLRPRARSIVLKLTGAATLYGSVEIGDGRSRPFSVGFTLKKREAGWRVVSASPPG